MKDYLEKRREELSKREEGFTLMEMLIVIAIIAVLIAIAIPIFTTQLEKSREATDLANIRSAYSELVTAYLTDGGAQDAYVEVQQTQANWQSQGDKDTAYVGTTIETTGVSGSSSGGSAERIGIKYDNTSYKYYKLSIDSAGKITAAAVTDKA